MSSADVFCTGPRGVARRLPAIKTAEPDGFEVRCPFPTMAIDHVDPFLLLHHLGPIDLPPSPPREGPYHPHRGVETVTYVLEGELTTHDINGSMHTTAAGGAQWMTGGAGVVHSETPSARLRSEGGRLEAVHVWVNLPSARKRAKPLYQSLAPDDVPLVLTAGGAVRVVTGEAFGVRGPAVTHTPMLFAHVSVWERQWIDVPAPRGFNAVAYGLRGRDEGMVTVFDGEGDVVRIHAGHKPAEVLVLVGQPLRQPIARYGPFVMTTRDELMEAIEDYQNGRLTD
jgi:redox-sensitive bicupin YhaK (pirin superfamily)